MPKATDPLPTNSLNTHCRLVCNDKKNPKNETEKLSKPSLPISRQRSQFRLSTERTTHVFFLKTNIATTSLNWPGAHSGKTYNRYMFLFF